jgi:hypothetical protein
VYELGKREQVVVVGQVKRLGRSISVWQKCLALAIKNQCLQGNWLISPEAAWGQNSETTMEDRELAAEELERIATEMEREASLCKSREVPENVSPHRAHEIPTFGSDQRGSNGIAVRNATVSRPQYCEHRSDSGSLGRSSLNVVNPEGMMKVLGLNDRSPSNPSA